MTYVIRPAELPDAVAASRIIGETVRISNAADYPPEVIETVVSDSNPDRVRKLIGDGIFFIAERRGEAGDGIVGVAGIVEETVRRFFILPECQAAGIGRALLEAVETTASAEGLTRLRVHSSLTAVGFYARLGFSVEAAAFMSGHRIVKMTSHSRFPGAVRRRCAGARLSCLGFLV